MFQIVIADHLHATGMEILRAAPDVSLSGPPRDRPALLALLPGAHALIVRSATHVDRELLNHAPGLRVAARAGASLENVDLDECTRRGILVVNVPDANVIAVVEHTFGMMLALARHIAQGYASLRADEWKRHELLGVQLYQKTLGIIGFGRHGRAMALRARAFGMQVLAYDPYINEGEVREQRVSIVGLDELLARADFISLHAALSPESRQILNARALARLKDGARIINCAHADLIDEAALLAALDSGQVAGAALDTFQAEPPIGNPLVTHPRVLAVPHLNQNTVESQTETARQVAQDVLDALRCDDYRNVVNLPFRPGVEYRPNQPYLRLAGKLGKAQGQLAQGRITRVEVEILGEGLQSLVRPVAAALLAGLLRPADARPINYVNAPVIAHEQGIQMAQARGLELVNYPNLISCRVSWEGGARTMAGVIFAGDEPRLVQYDAFRIDAKPEGYVLVLENEDVPGVIGRVGTLLGTHRVNIGEWRLARNALGGSAVSFINLDSPAPPEALEALRNEPAITKAQVIKL